MTKPLDDHIAITPNVVGRKPRVAGHRIKVQHIAIWHNEMKIPVAEIAKDYNLSLADIFAALAYYHDHKEEIDKDIKDDEEFGEAMRKETPLKLNEKLLEKINKFYADGLDPDEQIFLEKARKSHSRRVKGTW